MLVLFMLFQMPWKYSHLLLVRGTGLLPVMSRRKQPRREETEP